MTNFHLFLIFWTAGYWISVVALHTYLEKEERELKWYVVLALVVAWPSAMGGLKGIKWIEELGKK